MPFIVSSERSGRHNDSRTIIPSRFVDLGKLFDMDSEYELSLPLRQIKRKRPIADKSISEVEPKVERVPKLVEIEDIFGNQVLVEEFIVNESSVTYLFEDVKAQ